MLVFTGLVMLPILIIAILIYLYLASQKRKSNAVARVEDPDLGTERVISPQNGTVHRERATDPHH
ncbi:MAG: hypothetical protein JSS87_07715 [Acidobacteria bacterium]|nr:hypothetical protein [Acidobacteriota bacterium]